MTSYLVFGFQIFSRLPPIEVHIGRKTCHSCKLTPVMSQKHRNQAILRAFDIQDTIDMISDDDWDEYEARVLEGSSSRAMPTTSEHNAQSPSKSSPRKRKGEDAGTSISTDSDERATKRPRRSDEGESGKPFETVDSRTDPIEVAAPPKDLIDVDADDSNHSTHSVVSQAAHLGPSGRGSCAIKPIEIHVSAPLSRLSARSSPKRPSKLGASVDDVPDFPQSFLPHRAQTPSPPPKHSSPAPAPAVEKTEGNVTPPATAAARPKGKPAARASKLKLVRPEKKKSKKELEAEKKALDLREKKMTRREFIQYLYEEKLKEELENAPLKRLVLKDKVIWYAEPGNTKAFDSFDRRRYEMVRVPRSLFVFLLCLTLLIPLSSSFAMEPPSCRISTTQQ